jgi:hypothetical protein
MNQTTQKLWKALAGPLYEELLRSKETAFAHIFDANDDIRIAAIQIFDSHWNGSMDVEFQTACREIATSDSSDSVRVSAIGSIGKAMQCSRDANVSRLLADITKGNSASDRVRHAAYWALREVQSGTCEKDVMLRLASCMKFAMRAMSMTEDQIKAAVPYPGDYAKNVWDSAEQIDWTFVNQYASQE